MDLLDVGLRSQGGLDDVFFRKGGLEIIKGLTDLSKVGVDRLACETTEPQDC